MERKCEEMKGNGMRKETLKVERRKMQCQMNVEKHGEGKGFSEPFRVRAQ